MFLVNSVGYFSGNRYGADVDFFRPFKDERFSLLARIGYTGAGRWDGFRFQYEPSLWRMTWSLGGSFYWPQFNTQFNLKAEQYLLKEKGCLLYTSLPCSVAEQFLHSSTR